jgi:hypothetical protein
VRADPSLRGGALKLQLPAGRVLALKPRTNTLLHFVGSLVHSVEEVDGSAEGGTSRTPNDGSAEGGTSRTPNDGSAEGGRRISIVCEQYNLPDELLDVFPKLEVLRSEGTVIGSSGA